MSTNFNVEYEVERRFVKGLDWWKGGCNAAVLVRERRDAKLTCYSRVDNTLNSVVRNK